MAQIVELELSGEPPHVTPQSEGLPSTSPTSSVKSRKSLFWQLFRFALVGGLNTGIDLLVLNGLLLLWPTQDTWRLLAYNSFAYAFGAINSFLLNKYWTFRKSHKTTFGEVLRFALTTLCGIVCNDTILWIAGRFLHPVMINTTLWTNASKVLAISGTFLISYLGMRLWVFTRQPGGKMTDHPSTQNENTTTISYNNDVLEKQFFHDENDMLPFNTGLSVVLPAYNEERAISSTLNEVLTALNGKVRDFEVIVVNDGSKDRTAALIETIAQANPHVRLITHQINQGYGATLVDGFMAATKELTFFMDSDGQFDIRDLFQFFPCIDHYDAVLGYRLHRQDAWMRKLNAWGWKQLVGIVLGVHVRDIDCAFKLLHTDFLHAYPLESRGATVNAELLYKLKHTGATYKEIGVQHLPRKAGKATGAHPRVIVRALRELFLYERKWKTAEKDVTNPVTVKILQ